MTQHLDALTLGRWADGLLAAEEQQRAAAHLAQCAECRAQAAGQAQAARWLQQLAPEPPPPQLARNLLAALARRRRSEAAWGRLAAGSAVAALLGLALVALAWPDFARLLTALAGANGPLGSSASNLLEAPADMLAMLGMLTSSALDWGVAITSGAGAALMTGLVLLTAAAFGGLAQLLRPGADLARDPKGLVVGPRP
jgi:predicted anti-sigma-YlaC factor YlaD